MAAKFFVRTDATTHPNDTISTPFFATYKDLYDHQINPIPLTGRINATLLGLSFPVPYKPDFGDPWIPKNTKDYIPMYWACGVTPQLILQSAKVDISITHSPGKMFVTDLKDEDMAVI